MGFGRNSSALATHLVGGPKSSRSFQHLPKSLPIWSFLTANVTSWRSGQPSLQCAPQGDFWNLKKPQSAWPFMHARALCWCQTIDWAAQFHVASGQHAAANWRHTFHLNSKWRMRYSTQQDRAFLHSRTVSRILVEAGELRKESGRERDRSDKTTIKKMMFFFCKQMDKYM